MAGCDGTFGWETLSFDQVLGLLSIPDASVRGAHDVFAVGSGWGWKRHWVRRWQGKAVHGVGLWGNQGNIDNWLLCLPGGSRTILCCAHCKLGGWVLFFPGVMDGIEESTQARMHCLYDMIGRYKIRRCSIKRHGLTLTEH
jgi:hypothetical protein